MTGSCSLAHRGVIGRYRWLTASVLLQQLLSFVLVAVTATPATAWGTAVFGGWNDLLSTWGIFHRLVLDIPHI